MNFYRLVELALCIAVAFSAALCSPEVKTFALIFLVFISLFFAQRDMR